MSSPGKEKFWDKAKKQWRKLVNWTTSTTYYKCGNCDKVYYDSHVKNDGYVKFCPNNQCEKEFGRKLSSLYDGRPLCCMPGCSKTCYLKANNHYEDFCGKTHSKEFDQKYISKTELYRHTNGKNGGFYSSSWSRSRDTGVAHGQSYHTTASQQEGSCSGSGHVYQATASGTYGGSYGHHDFQAIPGNYWCNTCYMFHNHETDVEIRFYHKTDKYYEFTNFYDSPIIVDGWKWHTVEHFFQGQKYIGTPLLEKIRASYWPRDAFTISRSKAGTDWRRGDWDEVKIDVMRVALCAKFTQHGRLFDLLKSTGDRNLVEHTTKDNFWGDGGDGSGENMLGELLMEVRKMIIQGKLHHSSQSEATSSQSKGDNEDKEFSDSDHSSKMDEK